MNKVVSFFMGLILCVLISLSSLYSSLKFGLLAWPTLFVTIVSYSILSIFRIKDLKEVTVSHTLASSGSMVAGAVAYTLPVVFINRIDLSVFRAILLCATGALYGVLFSSVLKKKLVDSEKLDYPIGKAAYHTLVEISGGKKKRIQIFIPVFIASIFSFVRDNFKKIPDNVVFFCGNNLMPPAGIWISFMPIAIGALLSPVVVGLWVFSSVLFNYIVFPLISRTVTVNISSFRENLAFALMLGFGAGVLIKTILNMVKGLSKSRKNNYSQHLLFLTIAFVFFVVLDCLVTGISFLPACVSFVALSAATYLASRLTGESGINPMEVLGFIACLCISCFSSVNQAHLAMTLLVVTTATGLSGDMMNDFKSGSLIGASFKRQVISETIGSVIGVAVAVCLTYSLKDALISSDSAFTIPQAKMLSSILNKNVDSLFFIALGIAAVLSFFGLNTAVIGLGFYLPMNITVSIGIGAIISLLVSKKYKDKIAPIASGLLAGEGIVAMIMSFFALR